MTLVSLEFWYLNRENVWCVRQQLWQVYDRKFFFSCSFKLHTTYTSIRLNILQYDRCESEKELPERWLDSCWYRFGAKVFPKLLKEKRLVSQSANLVIHFVCYVDVCVCVCVHFIPLFYSLAHMYRCHDDDDVDRRVLCNKHKHFVIDSARTNFQLIEKYSWIFETRARQCEWIEWKMKMMSVLGRCVHKKQNMK